MKIEFFTPVAGDSNPTMHQIGNDRANTLSGKIALMRDLADADWYCFHHDDLTFATDDPYSDPYLEQQLALFDREHVGVAGVIGTLCLFESCMWWQPMRPQVTVGAITQGFANGQPDMIMADGPGTRTDAVSVDGCCMFFSRKFLEQFEAHPFHWRFLYDVDACLQALSMGYRVGILDWRTRHQSEGKFDPAEFDAARQEFFKYWKPRVDFPVINSAKFRRL